MPLQIYTDGGSRGNPGPAGAAAVIRDERGRPLLEAGFFIDRATNNVAEYTALILALEAAAKAMPDNITIFMDSELIVRQITGQYRVKDPHLAVLFQKAKKLLLKFDTWKIQHVPRAQNKRADALVNKALDARRDVIEAQVGDVYPDRPRPSGPPAGAGDSPSVGASSPVPQVPRPTGGKAGSPGEAGPVIPIVVRCIQDPKQDACSAGMEQDLEFLFTDATPGGLCIHATKAVLDTVLAIRYAASKGEQPGPVRVRCRLPGCGAQFEVRLASPSTD